MGRLQAGDVLSYSSGSTQSGPWGFRRVGADRKLLESCVARWPVLLEALAGRVPMLINAYPANLGRFEFGVYVDSYLSPKTVSRALQLAALEGHPAILMCQPLFAADLLWRHARAGLPLPEAMICAVAGYLMPRSLESAIRRLCTEAGCALQVVHFYGAAEVDASCLAAMERTPEGELVYYATSPEVRVELDDSRLLLGLVGAAGETIAERFDTGDCARPVGEGYVVWNHERVSPDVVRELEGWSFSEWARRTGYLRAGRERAFQLREGIRPDRAPELDFFEFGGRFGFSWLEKPKWSLSA